MVDVLYVPLPCDDTGTYTTSTDRDPVEARGVGGIWPGHDWSNALFCVEDTAQGRAPTGCAPVTTVGRAVRRGVDLLFSRHRAVFVVVVVVVVVVVIVVCRVFISRRASSVSGVWCVLVWLVALLHFLARQSRR